MPQCNFIMYVTWSIRRKATNSSAISWKNEINRRMRIQPLSIVSLWLKTERTEHNCDQARSLVWTRSFRFFCSFLFLLQEKDFAQVVFVLLACVYVHRTSFLWAWSCMQVINSAQHPLIQVEWFILYLCHVLYLQYIETEPWLVKASAVAAASNTQNQRLNDWLNGREFLKSCQTRNAHCTAALLRSRDWVLEVEAMQKNKKWMKKEFFQKWLFFLSSCNIFMLCAHPYAPMAVAIVGT